MKPRIEHTSEISLVGLQTVTSLANNNTRSLWMEFAPQISSILHQTGTEKYSVEHYDSLTYFEDFNPENTFEKWAAVAVEKSAEVPLGLERLIIPAGKYAVIHYIGKPSDAHLMFRQFYTGWLPHSEYQLDHRPHFAVMGDAYKGEHTDSEEEFWIPIQSKN